jgi:hypothetical protein
VAHFLELGERVIDALEWRLGFRGHGDLLLQGSSQGSHAKLAGNEMARASVDAT